MHTEGLFVLDELRSPGARHALVRRAVLRGTGALGQICAQSLSVLSNRCEVTGCSLRLLCCKLRSSSKAHATTPTACHGDQTWFCTSRVLHRLGWYGGDRAGSARPDRSG